MMDSVDERMITVQNGKAALGKGSLEKITKQERLRVRLTILKDLFGIGEEEVGWDVEEDDDWLLEDDEDPWI